MCVCVVCVCVCVCVCKTDAFELAYYDIAVEQVCHNITGTSLNR